MSDELVAHIETLACYVVSPTKNLLRLKDQEETKEASALLMHTKRYGTDEAHFVRSSPPDNVTAAVRNRLKADLRRLERMDEYDGRIHQAISEILLNKKRLMSLGRNEAEIRYAVCDPVISLVCDCFHYTLKLEESVRDNLEGGREVEDEREDAVLIDLRTLWPTGQEDDDPLQQQSASSSGMAVEMNINAEEARAGRSSIGSVMSKL